MQVLRELPWKFFLLRKILHLKEWTILLPKAQNTPTKAQQKLQLSTPQMHKEPRPRREFFPSKFSKRKKEEQEEDGKSAQN